MVSLGKIVLGIVLLNFMAITILLIYSSNRASLSATLPSASTKVLVEKSSNSTPVYKFNDPLLAWHILNELHPPFILPETYSKSIYYGKAHLGLVRDDDYCQKSRAYFVDHAEYIFLQKNILTDHPKGSLPRELAVKKIGRDMHPNISYALPRNIGNETVFDLLPDVNSIFINAGLHANYYLDKHFGCAPHQIYNHILGIQSLNSKAKVAEFYQEYFENYRPRPHCVPPFMPESYMLKNKTQCLEFFKMINSEEYRELRKKYNIIYVKKIGLGSHRGEGVFPFDDEQEKILRQEYEEGKKCGLNQTNTQMQKYVLNPLLLEGHKFDFRIYMLIASTDPLVLYYHDGFLRVSLYEYDPFSQEKGVHLTNTDISKKIFEEAKNGTWNGMNETELRNFQMWNYTRLQSFLIEKGRVNETWLDTGLRPQIQRAMAHIGRMTRRTYLNLSNTYELFGIDFILDDELNLWFIECNSGPMLIGTSEEKERFVSKMLRDHFEIVFGYLKSRVKRITKYINELSEQIPEENIYLDRVEIPDLESKKEEYFKLNKNYLEPEFLPSKENGFVKIIDDNLDGPERYAGYIPVDCYTNIDA